MSNHPFELLPFCLFEYSVSEISVQDNNSVDRFFLKVLELAKTSHDPLITVTAPASLYRSPKLQQKRREYRISE